MKTNRQLVILVILACTFLSCNKKQTNSSSYLYHVDVENNIHSKPSEIKLSEMANKVNYVPLETNDSSLVTQIRQLELNDDYIFVSDSHTILQFDKAGKFIKQIGRIGKGPSEHGRNISFRLDTNRNEIMVLSNGKKLMVYDIATAELKRSFMVDYDISKLAAFSAEEYIFLTKELPAATSKSTLKEVLFYTKDGKELYSIEDTTRKENKSMLMGSYHLYQRNDTAFFMGIMKERLRAIDQNRDTIDYAHFSLGNKTKWNEANYNLMTGEGLEDFNYLFRLGEYRQYFLMSVQMGFPPKPNTTQQHMLFNKHSNATLAVDYISDDIKQGIPFWPDFIRNDKLVMVQEAQDILDNLDGEQWTKFKSKIRESDNPVLIIAGY